MAHGLELELASNRLRSPFLHMTEGNQLLIVPPLKEALKHWWKVKMLQALQIFPIDDLDVLREGDSLVVLLTLNKSGGSSVARDSVGKSSMQTPNGDVIYASTVKIPEDRTWWHATDIGAFGGILINSLQTGPDGNFKGVYSFTEWATCAAYGGQVHFAFRSYGMVTHLTSKCSVPEILPEGLIGYFDSNKKRQWLHHPKNIELTYARVEYHTFCTFLAEAFMEAPGIHRYSPDLHKALFGVAGLSVPSIPEENDYEYDYEGPHQQPQDSSVNMRRTFTPEDMEKSYGWGFKFVSEKSEAGVKVQDEHDKKSDFDIKKLWGSRHALGFEGTGTREAKSSAKSVEFRKAGEEGDGTIKPVAFVRGGGDEEVPPAPPQWKGIESMWAKWNSGVWPEGANPSLYADGMVAKEQAAEGSSMPPPPATHSKKRKAPAEPEVWAPPSAADIESCTQQYKRPGREHFPLPKNTHVVIGHYVKNRNIYHAYCQRCGVWMDWPPATEKPHMAAVCSCEQNP